MNSLVSVICVCFNHEKFVLEALDSVLAQTYPNIEIVVLDDGSTDASALLIEQWIRQHPSARFLNLKINHGYCKAFNLALREAKGEYIIDFATDDVMLPEKIAEQVAFFQTLNHSYGVVFTDAEYIDKNGKFLRTHFDYLIKKKFIQRIPEGDIYADVLSTYFIPSPTMMVKRIVFQSLGGYDENLVYEDFDFWVRSSRAFKYGFLPKKLMKIRRNINSMSSGRYKRGDRQLHSTYLVCRKALHLNRNQEERSALAWRVQYELRQSVFSENQVEAKLFFEMLVEMNEVRWLDKIIYILRKMNFPLSPIRKYYHFIRYSTF